MDAEYLSAVGSYCAIFISSKLLQPVLKNFILCPLSALKFRMVFCTVHAPQVADCHFICATCV